MLSAVFQIIKSSCCENVTDFVGYNLPRSGLIAHAIPELMKPQIWQQD